MKKARFFKVRSFTDLDITYTVRQLPNGEWRCGCPNFVFGEKKRLRQEKSTTCDHIRKVRHIKMKNHGRAVKKKK